MLPPLAWNKLKCLIWVTVSLPETSSNRQVKLEEEAYSILIGSLERIHVSAPMTYNDSPNKQLYVKSPCSSDLVEYVFSIFILFRLWLEISEFPIVILLACMA